MGTIAKSKGRPLRMDTCGRRVVKAMARGTRKSGEVVEEGLAGEVFGNPQHSYTRALLASIPGHAFGGAPRARM